MKATEVHAGMLSQKFAEIQSALGEQIQSMFGGLVEQFGAPMDSNLQAIHTNAPDDDAENAVQIKRSKLALVEPKTSAVVRFLFLNF